MQVCEQWVVLSHNLEITQADTLQRPKTEEKCTLRNVVLKSLHVYLNRIFAYYKNLICDWISRLHIANQWHIWLSCIMSTLRLKQNLGVRPCPMENKYSLLTRIMLPQDNYSDLTWLGSSNKHISSKTILKKSSHMFAKDVILLWYNMFYSL